MNVAHKSGYLLLISLSISLFIEVETVNRLLPLYCFSLNKLKHTCKQFECDEYGKVQNSRFKPPHKVPTLNMKTIPHSESFTISPFTTLPTCIYREKQNSKPPTSILLFYGFEILYS